MQGTRSLAPGRGGTVGEPNLEGLLAVDEMSLPNIVLYQPPELPSSEDLTNWLIR